MLLFRCNFPERQLTHTNSNELYSNNCLTIRLTVKHS